MRAIDQQVEREFTFMVYKPRIRNVPRTAHRNLKKVVALAHLIQGNVPVQNPAQKPVRQYAMQTPVVIQKTSCPRRRRQIPNQIVRRKILEQEPGIGADKARDDADPQQLKDPELHADVGCHAPQYAGETNRRADHLSQNTTVC